MAAHGGAADAWLDLSTGINRQPWPVPAFPPGVLTALPTATLAAEALEAARAAYGTDAPGLALAGAQAAIGLAPRLRPPGTVRILAPTYAEHAARFAAEGWRVEEVADVSALAGADAAVVVNPNNPDGRRHAPGALAALAGEVGLLVVDESFADAEPALSLAPRLPAEGALVLRSLGKFYGLAGLRLGFAFGGPEDIARLAALAGPWAVSGPALWAGARALGDHAWAEATAARLAAEAPRLDALGRGAGWRPLGGTGLFRLFEVPGGGAAAQARLARARIWSRAFAARPHWLRLGLPGAEAEWARLARAMDAD